MTFTVFYELSGLTLNIKFLPIDPPKPCTLLFYFIKYLITFNFLIKMKLILLAIETHKQGLGESVQVICLIFRQASRQIFIDLMIYTVQRFVNIFVVSTA